MDIVYILERTKDNKELKYSLRSLSNIEHNKVFIVGDFPSFPITNIRHIHTTKLDSRYKTTTNNIKIACQNKEISEDFILMNDDFYIMNPIKIEDLLLDRGPLQEVVRFYHNNHQNLTKYDKLVEQYYLNTKEIGQNPLKSFELHTPMIINKTKFLSILKVILSEFEHCNKRSIYGNKFLTNTKTIKDVKVLSTNINDFDFNTNLLSTSDSIFKRVEPLLQQKFHNKSKYEA